MDKNSRILMYHGIISKGSEIPGRRDIGAELYDVSDENFRSQMQWLKDNNLTVSFIEDYPENSQRVIITFDDGEMNNYENALPILNDFGMKAYFFIIPKRVGTHGYMSWDEIKKLNDAGMRIGSHGLSHEILTNLKDTQIDEELRASKKNLERNLGIEITSLSIPRGFCNDKVLQMAAGIGYKHIFISDKPRKLTKESYSRIAVKSNWSMKRFEQAMRGIKPVGEVIGDPVKAAAKFVLREGGYNRLRSFAIKILK